MKKPHLLSLLFVCLVCCLPVHSQTRQKDLPFEEIIVLCEEQARQRVDAYIQKKIDSDRWHREYDAGKIEFTSDTLFIESVEYYLIEEGRYTTMDMKETARYMEQKYDKLLNKYYRMVMDRLTPEHKELFRQAQRTWIRYRDSEQEINRQLIASGAYTEGGTMWPVVAMSRDVEMVKQRVVYFYQLLDCI